MTTLIWTESEELLNVVNVFRISIWEDNFDATDPHYYVMAYMNDKDTGADGFSLYYGTNQECIDYLHKLQETD